MYVYLGMNGKPSESALFFQMGYGGLPVKPLCGFQVNSPVVATVAIALRGRPEDIPRSTCALGFENKHKQSFGSFMGESSLCSFLMSHIPLTVAFCHLCDPSHHWSLTFIAP